MLEGDIHAGVEDTLAEAEDILAGDVDAHVGAEDILAEAVGAEPAVEAGHTSAEAVLAAEAGHTLAGVVFAVEAGSTLAEAAGGLAEPEERLPALPQAVLRICCKTLPRVDYRYHIAGIS